MEISRNLKFSIDQKQCVFEKFIKSNNSAGIKILINVKAVRELKIIESF